METLDEFLEFVHQEVGLEVAPAEADASFDDLAVGLGLPARRADGAGEEDRPPGLPGERP